MTAVAKQEPEMLGHDDKEEIKAMIDNTLEDKIENGVSKGFDIWMKKYDLKPAHFVFLNAEYHKMMAQQSLIRRIVLTTAVTAVCAATVWAGEEWIKNLVVNALKSP